MSTFRSSSVPVVTVLGVSLYLALEGVDGSGKSTVASGLLRRFEAVGRDVMIVREPGGTDLGESIRELLLDSDDMGDWAEVFLFAAQRAELVRSVVGPALNAGHVVISDRTYYSSIAYQGNARGLGMERVRDINEAGLEGILPDHVFVLSVDPQTAHDREDGRDRIGREGVTFQELVAEGYRKLAHSDSRVSLVDGERSVSEVVADIWGRIHES